jgi:DNA-directed RNA polymerase specialized sigma subunit
METARIEAMLERYPYIDKEIQQEWNKMENIKERIKDVEEIKATKYSGMPHGSDSLDLSDKVVEIEEIVTKHLNNIKSRYEMLLELQMDVEEGLDRLNEIEKRIVKLHYFERVGMESVAAKINYTKQQAYRIRDGALKKF